MQTVEAIMQQAYDAHDGNVRGGRVHMRFAPSDKLTLADRLAEEGRSDETLNASQA